MSVNPMSQDLSFILWWIFLQAKAAGQAQAGHRAADCAAPQQADRAPPGETEPIGGGGTPEIPGTV